MKSKIVILIFILACSCNGETSFYNDYRREDLSRLPLIKPYELINVMSEKHSQENDTWTLRFKRIYTTKKQLEHDFVNATWVNIEDSIIYGHAWGKRAYPSFFFILDTKKDKEMIFEEEKPWRDMLTSLKCKQDTLYDIWSTFSEFRDKNVLPWPRPIK